ncbi:MAG: hypothetical protein Q4E28_01175 [Clostridia bacterium]|nr:hypothetical protein [Clostridia bacterium]
MQTAKLYLDRLSFGQDPISGKDLPNNSLFDDKNIMETFKFLSYEVEKLICVCKKPK